MKETTTIQVTVDTANKLRITKIRSNAKNINEVIDNLIKDSKVKYK